MLGFSSVVLISNMPGLSDVVYVSGMVWLRNRLEPWRKVNHRLRLCRCFSRSSNRHRGRRLNGFDHCRGCNSGGRWRLL